MNASYTDLIEDKSYYLIGRRVYSRSGVNMVWHEYNILGDELINDTSRIYNISNSVILANGAGIYKIVDGDNGRFVLQLNQNLPQYRLNRETEFQSANASAYNYLYGLVSAEGNIFHSRKEKDVTMHLETPAPLVGEISSVQPADAFQNTYNPNDVNVEYATVVTKTPINDSSYIRVDIEDEFNDAAEFKELTEGLRKPFLEIKVRSNAIVDTYKAYPDFSTVSKLKDVAGAITASLQQFDGGLSCGFGNIGEASDESANILYIYHSDKDTTVAVDNVYPSIGEFNLFETDVCLSTDNKMHIMGNSVKYFRYPEENNLITHYSLYRTKDIYPYVIDNPDHLDPRLQNNDQMFALIEDVPVCKIFRAYVDVTAKTMEVEGVFNIHDIENEMIISGVPDITITAVSEVPGNGMKFNVEIDGTLSSGNHYIVLGASSVVSVTKIDNSAPLTSMPGVIEGSMVVWENGAYSIVVSVDYDNNKVYFADNEGRSNAVCAYNFISRSYYDTSDDIIHNANLAFFPYKLRYNGKIKTAGLSAFNSGVLITSERYGTTIKYTSTSNIPAIGYYNIASQYNDSIQESIVTIVSVRDEVTVFTTNGTYVFNTKQSEVITTAFGESFVVLKDPIKVSSTIGIKSVDSWDYAGDGEMIVVTSEPAIRLFNGNSYGDDLTDGKIHNSYLMRMNGDVLIKYDPVYGVTVWGKTR